MTTWISDEYGNCCSVERYGSEDAARAALATLKDCRDCVNCSGCAGCSGCSHCSHCSGCLHCAGCSGCSHCSDCSGCSGVKSLESPRVVGPFRSDRYQFCVGKSGSIHAGCRVFVTMAEAREHWTKTRGGTPLGDETTLILDYLEKASALRA